MKHETFKIEAEQLLDLSRPSLRGLSFLLRHKELWPAGFVWDYGYCDSCAMGLARDLWGVDIPGKGFFTQIADAFGIGMENFYRIFVEARFRRGLPELRDVTPAMVADDIDALLASQ